MANEPLEGEAFLDLRSFAPSPVAEMHVSPAAVLLVPRSASNNTLLGASAENLNHVGEMQRFDPQAGKRNSSRTPSAGVK